MVWYLNFGINVQKMKLNISLNQPTLVNLSYLK